MHRISCAGAAAACLLTLSGCADTPTAPASTGPIRVSVVAATTAVVQSGQVIPVVATVLKNTGKPYPNFLLNFNVVEGGGSMFGGAELTNNKGEARDIWTIGFGSCRLNTLAVRAVDASTGMGTTYFTQTVATLGKISFYRRGDDGNSEIWVMNVDGSNQTRLTYFPAEELSSTWSPDGARIAFESNRDGFPAIFVMNEDGTNQRRLTDFPAWNPFWSPDHRIIFNGTRDGSNDIYAMNEDGWGPVNLTSHPASDVNPDRSPDGRRHLFSSNRDGNDEIYAMDAGGSNVTRLTDNPASDINPAWSPDGTKIAFDSDRDGNREIYVMNADGSDPVNLTRNLAGDSWPDWSPDGSRIVFASNRGAGDYDIYVMNADGSNPVNLTNFPAHNARPAWSGCVAR